MRRHLLLLSVAVALVVRGPAPLVAQTSLTTLAPPSADVVGVFAAYVEALRVQAGIPGVAAAIVGPDGVVWERAFGQQNVERFTATRSDTPFHFDGLTQVLTSTLVLRCVEANLLSLDDRVGLFRPDSPDANVTLGQLLTHTTGVGESAVFLYRPERLEPLSAALEACRAKPFRETLSRFIDGLAMVNSVPGPDAALLAPVLEGYPTEAALARYSAVLTRLASPYAVDQQRRRVTPSQYSTTTLTPAGGLISTVRDYAQFDFTLRAGLLLESSMLAQAWTPPVGPLGRPLPHGLGWFVQTYNGEPIVWQFGLTDNASSSLVVTAPTRGLTLVMLANSSGLVRPFNLAAGDLTVSPFARLFLGLFVR